MSETYVLGVDGGGTKTLAVVANSEGEVVGGRSFGNHQLSGCGTSCRNKRVGTGH